VSQRKYSSEGINRSRDYLKRLFEDNGETMGSTESGDKSEGYTAVLSHNIGNMGATDVNSLHLATCYAMYARNQVQQRNWRAPTAVLNLLVPH
jgi:hypothetical protein